MSVVDKYELDGQSINADSSLIQELIKRKKEITLKEIEKSGNTQIASEIRNLGAILIIPAVSESLKFQKPTLLFAINLGIGSLGKIILMKI